MKKKQVTRKNKNHITIGRYSDPFMPFSNLYETGGVDTSGDSKSGSPDLPEGGHKLSGADVASILGGTLGVLQTASKNAELADTSGLESSIDTLENKPVIANTNKELLTEWNAFSPIQSVTKDQVWGKKSGDLLLNAATAAGEGAQVGTSVMPGWGTLIGAAAGGISSGLSALVGANKAKKKAAELNKQIKMANQTYEDNLRNKMNTLQRESTYKSAANYFPYGGYFDPLGSGVIDYELRKEDLLNKRLKSSIAQNFVKPVYYDMGGNTDSYNNDVTLYNEGGTHEENPMGGVPIGTDGQGNPNLVEEGEVKYKDYIFSDRLFLNKELLEKYHLPNKYDNHSFADVAEHLSEEAKERPNDPLSKKGLDDSMNKLIQAQEEVRKENMMKQQEEEEMSSVPYLPADQQQDLQKQMLMQQLEQQAQQQQQPNVYDKGGDLLRMMPIYGSAVGTLATLLSKPDYSYADDVVKSAIEQKPVPVTYTPLNTYMTYKPFDTQYGINQLQSDAAAERNAAIENAGMNRGTAMANILASDYNRMSNLGQLYSEAEKYNLNNREKVNKFNRETDQFNAQKALEANIQNQKTLQSYAENINDARKKAAEMRESIDSARATAISSGLSNLFTNLGDYGKDLQQRDWNDMLLEGDYYGVLPFNSLPSHWDDERKIRYIRNHGNEGDLSAMFPELTEKIERKIKRLEEKNKGKTPSLKDKERLDNLNKQLEIIQGGGSKTNVENKPNEKSRIHYT